MKYRLSDICHYVKGKVDVSELDNSTYISTENMLPDKGGVTEAASLPTTLQTQIYEKNDVLVSNIRPYFKKIWFADQNGGCSNDVLVFRANEGVEPVFLYYVLADDKFFDFSMATSKGTKMPRGDKKALMEYEVLDFNIDIQKKVASLLGDIDEKIRVNTEINNNLEQQAMAIFKSWFVDFEPFNRKVPNNWVKYKLSDFLPVITGKKNANVSSSIGIYPFFSCSQDITWTDEYSFEGNAILVAGNGDFNVKFYNGKFEAYQRTYVLIPDNPRFSAWLFYVSKYNLNKITASARGSVIKFITKGCLEDFSFYAPSNLDDFDIIDQFTVINNIIASNDQENALLSKLRDMLLPKLMSGELDVSDIDL